LMIRTRRIRPRLRNSWAFFEGFSAAAG
jgi:hypothetical protein